MNDRAGSVCQSVARAGSETEQNAGCASIFHKTGQSCGWWAVLWLLSSLVFGFLEDSLRFDIGSVLLLFAAHWLRSGDYPGAVVCFLLCGLYAFACTWIICALLLDWRLIGVEFTFLEFGLNFAWAACFLWWDLLNLRRCVESICILRGREMSR